MALPAYKERTDAPQSCRKVKPVKCAACGVPLVGGSTCADVDTLSCPCCAISATRAAVDQEVAEYIQHRFAARLHADITAATANNAHLTVHLDPLPVRRFRFVVDLEV
ncbi:MAG: hypothetical protein ACFB2Z_10865 [Maricaulaceae bacterium]